MALPLLERGAPRVRGPEAPGPARDNAERALRAAIWLAIDAADRCGDGKIGDALLALYDACVKRAARG